jgi:hypothetical protein
MIMKGPSRQRFVASAITSRDTRCATRNTGTGFAPPDRDQLVTCADTGTASAIPSIRYAALAR